MHRYLLLTGLLLASMACSAQTRSKQTQRIDGRFDIGGRAIRLACQGTGEPTVVIDAGMGTAPVEDPGWQGIAVSIAPVTEVCLYDRAGLGGSEPAPDSPRTSLDAATDLRTALNKAGVRGPYLLVGHSIGGLHAQVFASRYPSDTAGLVLVSSTHPDQVVTWLTLLPPVASDEDAAITGARTFLTNMLDDPAKNEERLDTRTSFAQARRLKTLDTKPVLVVTHSTSYRMAPGLPEPLAIKLEEASQRMQKQFLALSSNATQIISANAGHGLPHEDPAFVTKGILQGVNAVRRHAATP